VQRKTRNIPEANGVGWTPGRGSGGPRGVESTQREEKHESHIRQNIRTIATRGKSTKLGRGENG